MLINKVINSVRVTVGGGACFIPALQTVKKLLYDSPEVNCSAMFFMTDGKPSDRGDNTGKGKQVWSL